MVIGGIDEKETSRLKKRLARKESQSNCKEKKVVAKPDVIAAAETIDSTTSDSALMLTLCALQMLVLLLL